MKAVDTLNFDIIYRVHNITQDASKIKIKKFKTLQSVSPVIGIIRGIRQSNTEFKSKIKNQN